METSITRSGNKMIVPPAQIREDESEVIAQLEMPGVTKEGLDIKIDGYTLTIDGKRSDDIPSGKYLIRERRHYDYHKAYTIDESIDREGISADLTDGILTLVLKVKETAKPRKIQVK